MQRSSRISVAALSVAIAAPLASGAAQQSDLVISPFVSFLPSAGSNPLAGLALTLAGDAGFGIRASANVALENYNEGGFGTATAFRPWGADADAVFSIGGRAFGGSGRGLAPFVFAGIGTATTDTLGFRTTHSNWSYGAGLSIPLGGAIDVFGESRWRMSRYVLPTASLAPSPTQEIRAGISLHFGMGSRGRGSRERLAASSPLLRLPTSIPAGNSSASAKMVLATADDYIGVPYKWGGTLPSTGFDCSGFVQYVFAKHGVELPRTARQQAQVGRALAPDWRAVTAGDLVMFEEQGRVSHVAIYAGHNRIIHATSSGGGVRYDDLGTQRGEWFMDHMVAARRVTPDARGLMLDLARGFATAVELDGPDHAPRPR